MISNDKNIFKVINKYPVLTVEEETKLAQEVKEGNLQSRDTLILSNLRLVISMAKRFPNYCFDDLFAEGNIGLILAVDKFDPSKGRFISYAKHYILCGMYDVMEAKSVVRVPRGTYLKVKKINRLKEKMEDQGKKVSVDELSDSMNVSTDVVKKLLKHEHLTVTSSDDMVFIDERNQLEELCKLDNYDYLERCVDDLPTRMKEMTILLYGLRGNKKHTLVEMSAIFKISTQRIHTLCIKSISNIKSRMMLENNF